MRWWTLVGVLLLPAAGAYGHDGVYRGPDGFVPPALRSPFDPAPYGQLPPRPPLPDPRVPIHPRDGPPPPSMRKPSSRYFATYGEWTFWFHYNREAIEALLGWTTPDPTALPSSVRARARKAIAAAVRETHRDRALERAAALSALGRVATTMEDLQPLMDAVVLDDVPTPVVWRALVGLGLARRSCAEESLGPEALVRIQARLIQVITSERKAMRGAACLALGLLGTDARATSDLWARSRTALLGALVHKDLPLHAAGEVLRGLALLPAASFRAQDLAPIRRLADAVPEGSNVASSWHVSGALHVLGEIGTSEDVRRLVRALDAEPATARARFLAQCAVVALARLATRMPKDIQEEIQAVLQGPSGARHGDAHVRGLAVMAPLHQAFGQPPEVVNAILGSDTTWDGCLQFLRGEGATRRAYAALALGILTAWRDRQGRFVDTRRRVAARLAMESAHAQGTPRTRAAFTLARAFLADGEAHDWIRQQLDRPYGAGPEKNLVETHALLGLAWGDRLGPRDAAPLAATTYRRWWSEPRTEMRLVLAAMAAGMTGAEEVIQDMGLDYPRRRSLALHGALAGSLVWMGTPEALETLVMMATRPRWRSRQRAIALAGLGVALDRERGAGMRRLRGVVAHRCLPPWLHSVYRWL